MRQFPVALLLGLASSTPVVADTCDGPAARNFVESFYSDGLDELHGYVPDLPHGDAWSRWFSPRLLVLYDAAAQYQQDFIASHPSVRNGSDPPIIYKPPFVDSPNLMGPQDAAPRFEVGAARAAGSSAWIVPVRSLRVENMSGWAVEVSVRISDARCVVDDVFYLDDEDPSSRYTLSEALRQRW